MRQHPTSRSPFWRCFSSKACELEMTAFGCTKQHGYCAQKSEVCKRPSLRQKGRDFRTKSVFAKYIRSPVLNTQGINRMAEGFTAGLGSTQVEPARGRDGGEIRLFIFLPDRAKSLLALMSWFWKKVRRRLVTRGHGACRNG